MITRETERATQQSTNHQCRHFPRVLAGRGLGDGEDSSVGLERVLVEQDGKVGAARARNELVRDSWSMITGFLQDDRMASSQAAAEFVWECFACWAWIPLQHREAVLVRCPR